MHISFQVFPILLIVCILQLVTPRFREIKTLAKGQVVMIARFQTCLFDVEVPALFSLPRYITINQHMSKQVLRLLRCVEYDIFTKVWSHPVRKICSGFLLSTWGHAQRSTKCQRQLLRRSQRTLSQETAPAPTDSFSSGPKAEITRQGKRENIF